MTETETSRRPWAIQDVPEKRLGRGRKIPRRLEIVNADGEVVAEINIAGEAAANALENAMYLVKAVNAHDDFVMDQMVRGE